MNKIKQTARITQNMVSQKKMIAQITLINLLPSNFAAYSSQTNIFIYLLIVEIYITYIQLFAKILSP